MKPWNAPSLRARLTWRMVLMQALVLMAFTSVAAIPIVKLISEEQGLDDGVIEDIAESIFWSTTLPEHVNVNRLQLMATTQAFGPFDIYREG